MTTSTSSTPAASPEAILVAARAYFGEIPLVSPLYDYELCVRELAPFFPGADPELLLEAAQKAFDEGFEGDLDLGDDGFGLDAE